MSDLWTEASRDVERETLDSHLTLARLASASLWPFLAGAKDEQDYANRKALSAERIERIAAAATEGDPALFGAVHAGLQDSLDEDFTVLHSDRVATRVIAETQSRQAARREASIRARVESEVVRRVLAAEVPPEFLEQQKKKGEGDSDDAKGEVPEEFKEQQKSKGDGESSDSDEMPDFIKDKIEDDKKESSRRTAAQLGDRATCSKCDGDIEYVGTTPDPAKASLGIDHGTGWWDRGGNFSCPKGGTHAAGTTASRRTAGVYCNSHDVWVGDGNADTHEGCSKEQKATQEGKESSRRTATHPGNDEFDRGFSDALSGKPFPPTGYTDSYLDGYEEGLTNKFGSVTAGENPFAKKTPDNVDAGSPDPVNGASDTWTCPNCQATDAYTQGGKELAEALKASEPIKCGACQQVDSSGGQDAQDPQQQAPNQAPVQASRRPFGRTAAESEECPDCSGTGAVPAGGGEPEGDVDNGYVKCGTCDGSGRVPFSLYSGDRTFESKRASRRTANTYSDANPYAVGTPDDTLDGPRMTPPAGPVSTRPRAIPSGPAPSPVSSTPMAPEPVRQGFASLRTLAAMPGAEWYSDEASEKCARCKHSKGQHSKDEPQGKACTKCPCDGYEMES